MTMIKSEKTSFSYLTLFVVVNITLVSLFTIHRFINNSRTYYPRNTVVVETDK